MQNGGSSQIVVNIRTLAANLTGVQRYARSVLEVLSDRVALIQPKPRVCGGGTGPSLGANFPALSNRGSTVVESWKHRSPGS